MRSSSGSLSLGSTLICVALLTPVLAAEPLDPARPSVHLEIVQSAGGAVDAAQRWLNLLQRLPFDSIRVGQARPGDGPRVERGGTSDRPNWRVTAVLNPRGELQLPQRVYRATDLVGLTRWLDELREASAPEGRATKPGPSERDLAQLRRELAPALARSTAGRSTRSVFDEIQQSLSTPVRVGPQELTALARAPKALDELQGMSQATALAALVRPAGLVLEPLPGSADTTVLRLVEEDQAAWAWPVGWPIRQELREAAPKLFDFLPVEIVDTPLSQALQALQPRIALPLLLDHSALAARQIDLQLVKVRYPAGRTFYKKLLDRLLFQARLELELRVDEANRPFLWVQPIELTQSPTGR